MERLLMQVDSAELQSPAHEPPPSASAEVGASGVLLRLVGRLEGKSLSRLWPQVFDALRSNASSAVTVDGSQVTYCDGAGLGLLVEIDQSARRAGAAATFVGLAPDLQRLLDRALLPAPAPDSRPLRRPILDQIGRSTASVGDSVTDSLAFLGELTAACAWAITHPRALRWRDGLLVAEKAGVNAVPVVCLLGWLMGLIISFQSTGPLRKFGAEPMIPTMLAVAMVRELGPLVTAIILAGRSGSAFAAELGTMKVTEEINALNTMGLDPVRFLVVPRVAAAMAMVPLLSLFGTFAGLVGGYVIMKLLGYGLPFYINEVRAAVDYVDLLQGMFKAGVFAFLIAGVGCQRGLLTKSGPGAVGDSTTRAVVAGIVLVVVADGVLGVVFYFIGI